MRKPIFCAALLTVILCLAASKANAQETWELSSISYDDSTNTIYGYSSTEIDYYCEYDYSAYVEGYLYKQDGSLLDSGWDEEPDIAEVYTSASADSSTQYTLDSYHDVVERYYHEVIDRSPDGCWPCDGCNTDCYYFQDDYYWYDTYGYSFISPGYYGPWWDIYGYGPATEVEDDEYDDLGETSDSITSGPGDVSFDTASLDDGMSSASFNQWDQAALNNVECSGVRFGVVVTFHFPPSSGYSLSSYDAYAPSPNLYARAPSPIDGKYVTCTTGAPYSCTMYFRKVNDKGSKSVALHLVGTRGNGSTFTNDAHVSLTCQN
jgi:hypothetical protein